MNELTTNLDVRVETKALQNDFEPLNIERQQVPAAEIFGEQDIDRRLERRHERAKFEGNENQPINLLKVDDFPLDVAEQDLPGRELSKQAEALLGTELMQSIGEVQKTPLRQLAHKIIMRDTIRLTNHLRRNENIELRHGSKAERTLAWQSMLSEWPPGIDLYDTLQFAYPAYHAQMVGQRPAIIEDSAVLNDLLQKGLGGKKVEGPFPLPSVVKDNVMLGLYPVIEVDKQGLAPEAEWKSQDQIGRRELCNRIISQAEQVLAENPEEQISVVDYAGGVGNLTEVLFKQIDSLKDEQLKTKLQEKIRVVVRELHQGQINGGKTKFEKLEQKYPWIKGKYAFVQSDITQPIDDKQKAALKEQLGEDYDIDNTVVMGMTAYTLGALPPFVLDKMAGEIKNDCYYFDAIDFSSPAWRQEAFLRQTGEMGKSYLRAVHGVTKPDDSAFTKWWLGSMRIVGGLADHYNDTWPGEWGHNSGYGVNDDRTLRKPSIIEFGENLQKIGLKVDIKSTVNTFSHLYAGKTESGKVALAVVPGWVRDDIKIVNEDNRKPKSQKAS